MADRKGLGGQRASQASLGEGLSPSIPATSAAASKVRSTSPYGTRSRNRGARVNYAEDKDSEMDFEYTTPPAPASIATPAKTQGTSEASTRRQSTVTNNNKDACAGAVARENSTYTQATVPAVGSTTTAGKKRKGTSTLASASASTSASASALAVTATSQSQTAAAAMMRPLPKDYSLTNMLAFSSPTLQAGKLVADDGTVLQVHDHIYMICEPPGEPYYLARIMEFLHQGNDSSRPIDSVRVNWYYRPKDIQRKVTDTRMLFASMHSDCCPLNSIRGKCYIAHRSEIENLDEYRKLRDHFYFERMFDRYIHRYYDVIPTHKVRNVPENIRKVLIKRWKYLLVEPQRGKELCSQMKECRRCSGYCANNDSVHCAVCDSTYHMNCVRPPLLKKPSRGFAWACGPCNRAQERKLQARNGTANASGDSHPNGETEEEHLDDDEEEMPNCVGTETPSEAAAELLLQEPTPEQRKLASMWTMRYLGQHCKIEDALDYDDRIYPRASSRLGPKHQAVVPPWPGRPFELVKPAEGKRRYAKGPGGRTKLVEIAPAKAQRPPWVIDEPPGYIERGGDDGKTSTLMFKVPVEGFDDSAQKERKERIEELDRYMDKTQKIAEGMKMKFYATNFVDKAAELLFANDWDEEKALEQLSKVTPVKDLKEPRLKPDEVKRFEEGVAKYGSELHLVCKHVKTRKEADIVRFYYQWKKTEKGREIWGNYEGRRSKKEGKKKDSEANVTTTGPKLADDVADDEDDSAFDVEKANTKKRGFQCKFCHTKHSRQWRRAPGVPPGTLVSPNDKGNSKKKQTDDRPLISALCRRCAELWRRYGIVWEDPDEIQKKVNQGGGRAWKRRIDEELLRELYNAQQDAKAESFYASSATPQPGSRTATPDDKKEPPRKKAKTETNGVKKAKASEKHVDAVKETPPPPPPPEPPKPKLITCRVCAVVQEAGKDHATCRECKMTVHKKCYGVEETRIPSKWLCDMCSNDKNPVVSTNYECVLCPHPCHLPNYEPEKKPSHKKKKVAAPPGTDSLMRGSPDVDGRKIKDSEKYKPNRPREPMKKTANNNWAHVLCAVWTPEIKFSDASNFQVVEGIGLIPQTRWLQQCKICGAGNGMNGACVQCSQPSCHAFVHVWCARQAGWTLGFDVQPVKGSRRDAINTVKFNNEIGHMIAGVWCPEHGKAQSVHQMSEVAEEDGQTALEVYVRAYKQADLALTGTVRKANLVSLSTKANNAGRRNSLIGNAIKEGPDPSTVVYIKSEGSIPDRIGGITGLLPGHVGGDGPKECISCKVTVSPLWWKVLAGEAGLTNGSGPEPHINGTTPENRVVGLHCNRCHIKKTSVVNGEDPQQKENPFLPLPPLQTFLEQQHMPPAPQLGPAPPTALPPLAVPLPTQTTMGIPVSSVISQPIIVPPLGGPLTHHVPMGAPIMAHSPSHLHHPSSRSILHHIPPPSHAIPLPQISPTARTFHHVSPPPRGMHHPPPPTSSSSPLVATIQTHLAPHPVHHQHLNPISSHKPPPPPHHPSHSSPSQIYSHPPPPMLMSRRPSSAGLPPPTTSIPPAPQMSAPTAPMSHMSPHHIPPPPPPQLHPQGMQTPQMQRQEEPKRVLSAASGSPALANLLS